MVLGILAELDIHLCTMYSLRIYANKVTWDPWMTQRRSIYSGVLWRLFPSESCHKDSEWQRAPAVFRDSENRSYICNFCSISSLLTAKGGVLSTGWSIPTESQEIQLTKLHCEGELLLLGPTMATEPPARKCNSICRRFWCKLGVSDWSEVVNAARCFQS